MTTCTLNSLPVPTPEVVGTANHREPIRIGVVVDASLGRGWLADLVRQIKEIAQAVADPVVLFEVGEALEAQKESWLFQLWRYFDGILFGSVQNSAASQLTDHRLEFISRGPDRVGNLNACSLSKAALDALRRSKADLIVQIGGPTCIQEMAGIAKYGVWWVPEFAAGASRARWFRAAQNNHGIFETLLKAYSGHEQQCRILRRSFAAADGVSLSRHLASRRRKISELVMAELIDFERSKARYLGTLEDRETGTVDDSDRDIASPPTNGELLRFFFSWAIRGLKRRIERCFWR